MAPDEIHLISSVALQAAIAANVDAYYDEVEYQREQYGQYNVWPPTHNQYGGMSEEGRMMQEVGCRQCRGNSE